MPTEPSRLAPVLAGRTVLIAADRRSTDFAGALERRGARVLIGPAMRNVPLEDDAELLASTRVLIEKRPDIVVVTTGVGFRGWLTAAQTAGIGSQLREVLGSARLLARGPKSAGAIQAAELDVDWVAESETSREICEHLLSLGVSGQRIAVQHHGAGADGLDTALAHAGADVVSLVVYRWGPPKDPQALAETLAATARGEVDVVAFTSAPGTEEWFAAAERAGVRDAIVDRFKTAMIAAAVGPVTAVPLQERGITPIVPERFRLGALARLIVSHFTPQTPVGVEHEQNAR